MKDKIIKNTFFLFSGTAVVQLLSFLLMVVIARTLGDVGVGQYSFVFAFGFLIIMLGSQGLEFLIVKEVPGNKSLLQRYVPNILSIKIILALLAVVTAFFASRFLDKDPQVAKSLYVVFIIYGFNVVGTVFASVLRAHNRMDLTSVAEIAERVIALTLACIFLRSRGSLYVLVCLLLASRLSREGLYVLFARKYFSFRLGFAPGLWKQLLVQSFPITLNYSFLLIYSKIDTIMLSLMINDQVTGWYNAAYRVIDVINFIPVLLVLAILPSMGQFARERRDVLADIFRRSYRYLVILAFPIGVGIALLAPDIVRLVFGEQFANSAGALRVLIVAEIIVFTTYLGGHLLNIIDRQIVFTKILCGTVTLNIVLNVLLIPRFTYMGAGVATCISELVMFVFIYRYIRRHFDRINIWAPVWRPMLAACAMGLVIMVLPLQALWFVIPVGAVAYGIVFVLLGGINVHDRDALKTAISLTGFNRRV